MLSSSLGARLVAAGLVTAEQIDGALAEQRRTGMLLGEILLSHGILFEADLSQALAGMWGMTYRDLSLHPPDPTVLDQIPEVFCRRHDVLPLGIANGVLDVAITDPRDIQTLDDLKVLVRVPFRAVVVALGQLRQAIERGYQTYQLVAPDGPSGLPESQATAASRDAGADISGDASLAEDEEPVVRFVNQLLRRAIDDRASDLHIEPTEAGLRIRFRVDGMLHDVMNAPASFRLGVISRVKVMTGMDITEHRRPQDGRVSINARGLGVDIRSASLPTIYGEALVLRLLRKDQGLLDIKTLGFLPDSFNRYQSSFRKTWGMVLVTGPTGSGKSTTLYATVNELNVPSRNTITVEDPIEYRVAGIKQTQVNTKVGYTFASGLRAALRSDPDVILIGEIRDLETARIAAESALTGHLVLSTLHANDAASSTTRLMDMGLPPYLVTSALECVVAQRLLRRLCDRCKQTGLSTAEELLELEAMGLVGHGGGPAELYRAQGCEQCGRNGYRGRLAVHEVMVMTDQLRVLVLQRASADVIATAAIGEGMRTLRQDAFAKVQAGETTLDELRRVLA